VPVLATALSQATRPDDESVDLLGH
jgi:hypothetical protein